MNKFMLVLFNQFILIQVITDYVLISRIYLFIFNNSLWWNIDLYSYPRSCIDASSFLFFCHSIINGYEGEGRKKNEVNLAKCIKMSMEATCLLEDPLTSTTWCESQNNSKDSRNLSHLQNNKNEYSILLIVFWRLRAELYKSQKHK